MNPINGAIKPGLKLWRKAGAKVSFLSSSTFSVPQIWLGSSGKKVLLIASGLHLEETSGPFLLFDEKILLPVLEPLIKKGVNVLIYPLINQYGLAFSPLDDEELLRFNSQGFNYNDGWGLKEKCEEVGLVENDILKITKSFDLFFAISMHEDSDIPKKGYIYLNRLKNASFRKNLRLGIQSLVKKDILASEKDLKEGVLPSELVGAKIEDFSLVESKDEGAMEQWLAYSLNVPTVLSEAPFGLNLATRKSFHLAVVKSALRSLLKQF